MESSFKTTLIKTTEAKDGAAMVQPDMLAFTLCSRIHSDYYSQRQNQLIVQHSNAVLYPTMYAHAGAVMGATLAAQEVKDNNPSAKMVSAEEWKGTPSFLSSTYHRRGVYENGVAGSERIPDQTDLVGNKNIKNIKKQLFGTTIVADEAQERDTAQPSSANNTSKPQSLYAGGICKKIEQNASSPIPSDVGFTYRAPPTGSVVSSDVASASGLSHELKPHQICEDDLELKRLRRKLSNRESAKRSRQRKQLEIESLETVDKKLRVEINQLQAKLRQVAEDCANLREQNTEIVEELVQEYGEKAQELIGAYEPGYEELIFSKSSSIRGEGGSDEDGSDNTENEEELKEEDLNEKTDVHPIQFHQFL